MHRLWFVELTARPNHHGLFFICNCIRLSHLRHPIPQENEGPLMFCFVCFGDPSSPLYHGYQAGVLALLVVVMAVLTSFGMMFWNIRKRALKNK